MKAVHLFVLIGFFIFCHACSFASPGHLLINLPDLSEKQVDSVRVWFASDNNIAESGICLDNKLLMIRLLEKNEASVDEIFDQLKKHGVQQFFLKDEIALDRFRQNCTRYIAFP